MPPYWRGKSASELESGRASVIGAALQADTAVQLLPVKQIPADVPVKPLAAASALSLAS